MKEIEVLLKAVSDGLQTMADGLSIIAKKVESIAKEQAKAKPSTAKSTPVKKAKKAPRKPARQAKVKSGSAVGATEKVYAAIHKAGSGIDNATLCANTGLDKKQVANALFRLKKDGKIKTIQRGVYTVA